MISINLILSGIIIGIATSAPVGGVNVLCLNRAVHYGFLAALSVGMGALVADIILASSFAFGLSIIEETVQANRNIITIVGSVILLLFGLRIFFSTPDTPKTNDPNRAEILSTPGKSKKLIKEFSFAFFMTMTNPGAILAFTGIIAGTSSILQGSNHISNAFNFILGIGIGSFIWWFFISFIASASRRWLNGIWLTRIHKGSGILLILFGIVLISTLFDTGLNMPSTPLANIINIETFAKSKP